MRFDRNTDPVSRAAQLIQSVTSIPAFPLKFPNPSSTKLPYIVVEEAGVSSDGYADDDGHEIITTLNIFLISAENDSLSRRTCDAAMLEIFDGYTSMTSYDEQDEVVIKMYSINLTEVYYYGE